MSEFTTRAPEETSLKASFRTETHKYIATLAGPVGDDLGVAEVRREELYDLIADPGERVNAMSPEAAAPFRSELRAFLDAARLARSTRKGESVELDDDALERLKTLGYVHD